MTTAHKPTWHPAVGGEHAGSYRYLAPRAQFSVRDMPSHTMLKARRRASDLRPPAPPAAALSLRARQALTTRSLRARAHTRRSASLASPHRRRSASVTSSASWRSARPLTSTRSWTVRSAAPPRPVPHAPRTDKRKQGVIAYSTDGAWPSAFPCIGPARPPPSCALARAVKETPKAIEAGAADLSKFDDEDADIPDEKDKESDGCVPAPHHVTAMRLTER
jgi:hypothetical protein